MAALLDEKRLFSNLRGSVTLFCVNIEAKCHLSLLLCFVCLIVLRENCTTSLQISKRWADAILYFKKHMGPTLHFVLLVPADNLNLALSNWLSRRACVQILVPLLVSCVALDMLHKHSLPNLPPRSYVPHRVFVKIM